MFWELFVRNRSYAAVMENSACILSHQSALNFWLRTDRGSRGAPQLASSTPQPALAGSRPQTLDFFDSDPRIDEPVHLLTCNKGSARPSDNFIYHYNERRFSPRDFYRIADGLYVCAPWLALVQSCTVLSEAKAAQAAMNLCGLYFFEPFNNELPKRKKLLTSASDLEESISQHSRLNGSARALWAVRHIADESRSPEETNSMLVTCLPLRLGGYGMRYPNMNYVILPDRRRAQLMGQNYFEGDLCWPDAKVVVEYHGREHLSDMVHDERRRTDLQALGWTMHVLWWEMLSDGDKFDQFARKLARDLGRRVRLPDDWREKNLQLRRELGLSRMLGGVPTY